MEIAWDKILEDLKKEDARWEVEKVKLFKKLEDMTEKELLVQIAKYLYIITERKL